MKDKIKVFILLFAMACVLMASIMRVNAKEPVTKIEPEMVKVSIQKEGIDVSKWNGQIDWQSVKDSGIDYAIIRVGYGDDLSKQDDETAIYNMDECARLGIPFGVYIYSYAQNEEDAQSEASHVLRMIEGYELSYPVYLDMEEEVMSHLEEETLGIIADKFCTAINSAGYEAGVYSSTYWFNNILTSPVFDKYPRWVAQYNDICEYKGNYTMWQHSELGNVPGITGFVDMNVSYETELVKE